MEEKTIICVETKKKYNTLSEQGDTRMLTLHDFAEGLKDVCPESILFSAVPEPDVDFVTDLVKHQPGDFLKIFADLTIGLADAEDFFANLFDDMSKEKISKIELLTRGQTNNKLWYNCRKVVITAQSVLTKMNKILKPTGGCVDMWSLCQQHISGLFFTNPFLLTLYFKLIFHLFFYFQCHMFAIKK